MSIRKFIADQNQKTRDDSAWRELRSLEKADAREILADGKRYLNFSSNDYLGYSTDPRVIEAAQKAVAQYGAGGRSSRLISGTLDLHRELETKLAAFKGTEAALLFPTGFMANLSVMAALMGPGDAIILDRLNHASLIDGAGMSRARIFVYDHASPESLEKVLKRTRNYGKRLVATDSLFSMDGDFAPLPEIAELCRNHGVWLMADDAHAVGVFGQTGSGAPEHFNLQGKVEIVVGTCSKALGSQGGFVCGPKDLIDLLINRARPLIYTTALAPAAVGAAIKSLELIQKEPERRAALLKSSARLNAFVRKNFGETSGQTSGQTRSASQIVPLLAGSNERALDWSRRIQSRGIYAPAIRPPTVPKNESRLRFSLTNAHTAADLAQLEQTLMEISQPAAVS